MITEEKLRPHIAILVIRIATRVEALALTNARYVIKGTTYIPVQELKPLVNAFKNLDQ